MKKLYSIAFLLMGGLFVAPQTVFGSLVITEIMHNAGTGKSDWIEVYNSSEEAVFIEGFSYYGKDIKGSNINIRGGGFSFPPQTYIVFAKENTFGDSVVFRELTSIGLASTGERGVGIRGVEESGVNYSLGDNRDMNIVGSWDAYNATNGKGASLQLQPDGVWIAGLPTPGEENTAVEFQLPSSGDEDENVGDDFLSLESDWPFTTDRVYVSIVEGNQRAFVGEDILLSVEARKRNGDEVRIRNVSWAFGDGDGSERESARHSYRKPGVYRVVTTVRHEGRVYQDAIRVHVVDSDVIHVVPEETSVTFQNTSQYEIDISGWSIEAGGRPRDIAEYTYILPGESLSIEHTFTEGVSVYAPDGSRIVSPAPQESALLQSTVLDIREALERLLLELQREP